VHCSGDGLPRLRGCGWVPPVKWPLAHQCATVAGAATAVGSVNNVTLLHGRVPRHLVGRVFGIDAVASYFDL